MTETPFTDYTAEATVNWSGDLEELHEESSRDHFLDVATRRALVDGIAPVLRSGSTIADLGCSTGYLLEDLHQLYPEASLVGVDLVAEGLRKAAENAPSATLMRADVCKLPLDDASVDAVVSANLLEHVPRDDLALGEIYRVLRPGGRAAVVVPAGPGTYDYYDRFLEHERRYRRGELAGKGKAAGLGAVSDSFIGTFIFPPFWAQKKWNRRKYSELSATEIEQMVRRDIGRTQNSKLGELSCSLEQKLRKRGTTLPFGIRSFTVFERLG